jgi:phosphatidylethanolamine-binding protein (PEBP) family uncharacterized protein
VGIRHLSVVSVVLLAIAVTGCGSSTTGTTTENKATIAFESPVVNTKGFIPAGFKCNAAKVWIPMRWGALPADTKELVIYVARFGVPQRTVGGTARASLLAQELIIGLKPTLHGLPVGKLPHGALIGIYEIGNKRASVCPAKGSAQGILFGLYALNHRQEISKGAQSGSLLNKLRSEAVAVGSFTAGYS